MIGAGLSTDQGPAISVPFRFFLTAPFFALAGSVVLTIHAPLIFSTRFSTMAYGVTHLFTLGFIAMIMVGAMFQMLPVIGGIAVQGAIPVSAAVYGLIVPGTVLFSAGFFLHNISVSVIGMTMVFVALLLFSVAILYSASLTEVQNHTIRSMRHAVYALLIGIGAGLLLGASHYNGGLFPVTIHTELTAVHLAMVLVGWIALLIMGVSFQVLPMFFVTPEYPVFAKRYLTGVVLVLLVLWSALILVRSFTTLGDQTESQGLLVYALSPETWIKFLLSAAMFLFAFLTLRVLQKRMRKIFDATVWYFRIAMFSLVGATTLLLLADAFQQDPTTASVLQYEAGLLFLYGFAISTIIGMLGKIMPFLSWFHLTAAGAVDVMPMRDMIPGVLVKWQLGLYLLSLAGIILAPLFFLNSWPVGVVLFLTFSLLSWNLIGVFVQFLKKKKSIAFSGMGTTESIR